MPRLASLLVLLGFAPALAANNLQDYAYQAVLSQTGQQLQRVDLPIEVILDLKSPDLNDLAVFNVNGKALPHSITRAPERVTDRVLDLPFYEFNRFLQQHSKTVTKREQNKRADTITELETTETIAVQSVRKDYLLELGTRDSALKFDRIELQWTHQPASQILKVRVEVGNELDQLRVIEPHKSLTNRESDDRSWRSIEQIPGRYRYLRLTPVNKITSFELQKASGHYREITPAPEITHQIDLDVRLEDGDRIYFLQYPSAIKAEAIRIIPANADSVINGDLYGTWGKIEQPTPIRFGFSQHNIADAGVKPSQPIRLPRRAYTSLSFTTKTDLPDTPRIELVYPQYEVIFLGDGNGPYTLAWGNHEFKARTNELSALLEGNLRDAQQRSAVVRLGSIGEAGGVTRLIAQAELPWKKWLLWSLLVAAALVTGRMSLSLFREMNNPQ
jgi:hypothetical protein